MNMNDQRKAYLYTAVVILSWSTVATVFKLALETLDPLHLLAYSSLVATLVILIFAIGTGRLGSIRETPNNILFGSIFLGLLNPFIFYIVLFAAYDLLPGQIAMTINFSWPMVLSLFAIPLLKQTLHWRSYIAFLLALSGVWMIAFRGEFQTQLDFDAWGILLVLLSTVIWAIFWIYNTRLKGDTIIKLLLNFTTGTILIFLYMFFSSDWQTPNGKEWFYVIYVGLFEMSIPFIFWMKALSLSRSAAQVSILIFIIPFISLLILNGVLNEEIYLSTFLGIVLISGGIVIQQLVNFKKT